MYGAGLGDGVWSQKSCWRIPVIVNTQFLSTHETIMKL